MAVKSNLVVAHFSKSSAVIQEGSSLSYLLNRHTTPPIFNFRGSGRDRVYSSPHNFYKESEEKELGSFLYNFYLSGVSLILKVYDLPRGMKKVIWKMNYWTIWWRLGTWIKWLNTVTSGSQESPVIAIFPSSTIAEHALNTMSRFKFKLCHSQHKKKKKQSRLCGFERFYFVLVVDDFTFRFARKRYFYFIFDFLYELRGGNFKY